MEIHSEGSDTLPTLLCKPIAQFKRVKFREAVSYLRTLEFKGHDINPRHQSQVDLSVKSTFANLNL